jgi:hypothetical protein
MTSILVWICLGIVILLLVFFALWNSRSTPVPLRQQILPSTTSNAMTSPLMSADNEYPSKTEILPFTNRSHVIQLLFLDSLNKVRPVLQDKLRQNAAQIAQRLASSPLAAAALDEADKLLGEVVTKYFDAEKCIASEQLPPVEATKQYVQSKETEIEQEIRKWEEKFREGLDSFEEKVPAEWRVKLGLWLDALTEYIRDSIRCDDLSALVASERLESIARELDLALIENRAR